MATADNALVDGDMVSVTLRGSVKLTGGQLAAIFWNLGDDEQAEFFTTLASKGGQKLAQQMYSAADNADGEGRAAMQIIGDMAK